MNEEAMSQLSEAAERVLKHVNVEIDQFTRDVRLLAHAALASQTPTPGPRWTPDDLAKRFHQTYEYLAPKFGYETRKESAVEWEKVPEQNRKLMTAVCEHILKELEVEAAGPGDKFDVAEFSAKYWEPLIKRKVSADEFNKTDLAYAQALYDAGRAAGPGDRAMAGARLVTKEMIEQAITKARGKREKCKYIADLLNAAIERSQTPRSNSQDGRHDS
jgi:hypothetical protein